MLVEIGDKKEVLIEKIETSLRKRSIEIRDGSSGVLKLVAPDELHTFLRSRREFMPLLGKAVERYEQHQ